MNYVLISSSATHPTSPLHPHPSPSHISPSSIPPSHTPSHPSSHIPHHTPPSTSTYTTYLTQLAMVDFSPIQKFFEIQFEQLNSRVSSIESKVNSVAKDLSNFKSEIIFKVQETQDLMDLLEASLAKHCPPLSQSLKEIQEFQKMHQFSVEKALHNTSDSLKDIRDNTDRVCLLYKIPSFDAIIVAIEKEMKAKAEVEAKAKAEAEAKTQAESSQPPPPHPYQSSPKTTPKFKPKTSAYQKRAKPYRPRRAKKSKSSSDPLHNSDSDEDDEDDPYIDHDRCDDSD